MIKHAINILTPCQLDPSHTFPFNDFLELVCKLSQRECRVSTLRSLTLSFGGNSPLGLFHLAKLML